MYFREKSQLFFCPGFHFYKKTLSEKLKGKCHCWDQVYTHAALANAGFRCLLWGAEQLCSATCQQNRAEQEKPFWCGGKATTAKQRFHGLDSSQVGNTEDVGTDVQKQMHCSMGKPKNQASPLLPAARCQADTTVISLGAVNTSALYFVVVISAQQNKSLIQSIKSKQIWKITLPDSIQKY